ncbi:MAG: DUF1080 domain-containing protein [Candidatus Sumerlaeia bacterium]|nr:DUF1080 domain-containing protein [Candidatus Sumerlaeia bacterium]
MRSNRRIAALGKVGLLLVTALMIAGMGVRAPAAEAVDNPNALLAGEKEQGFVPIFNGKDLSGWVMDRATTTSFEVKDGILQCLGKGDYQTILRTTQMYENFELRLEYMTPSWCEGGVLFHVPEIGRATRMGTKIQIYHPVGVKPEPTVAGSIFGVLAPPKDMARKAKQWNDLRILMDWPRLRVELNGEMLHDINMEKYEELKYRERRGFIALQDIGSRPAFRRIRIRTLPDKDKWEALFNGRDFTGWHEADNCKWEIRDGVIHASEGTGYQITDRRFQDFELKALVRTSPRANGGIFFRWNRETTKDKDRGYEIQIRQSPDASHPTGSIYEIERARDDDVVKDNQWYWMHIIAQGPHIISRVDGKTVAEIHDAKKTGPGHIALQMHSYNSWVEWKEVKIKDLSK